jgi:DUF4097 and DUF4098 domain-containing protein YvlB
VGRRRSARVEVAALTRAAQPRVAEGVEARMRRLVLAAAVTSVTAVAVSLALSASAGPVPLNTRTEAFAVHQDINAVQITSDYGSITVKPGDATKVTANEAWNLYAPTITVVVRNGVLKVDATCTKNLSVADTVTVQGLTDPANDCTDDLSLVVPSSVDVTATSVNSDIATSSIDGVQKLQAEGAGAVSVTDAGDKVDASSPTGAVTVTRMHGSSLAMHSDTNDVTATDITAPSITLTTSNGQAKLSNATSRSVRMSSDATNVIVSHLHADELQASSSNGQVQVDHSNLLATTVHSDSGAVTVNDVTSPSITATSSNGVVSVEAVRADAIVAASDTADVQVSTHNRVVIIDAHSSNGAVFVDVPKGSYDINATSDTGTVTVTNLKDQSHAKHRIVAHSDNNNVTVNGY